MEKKSKEEWDKPFEDPKESSVEELNEIEQLAEKIRAKHMPNGCINLAPHIRGKKAYKIEKQTIRAAMIEFSQQTTPSVASEQTAEAVEFAEFIAINGWCWSGTFGWHSEDYQEGRCVPTQVVYNLFREQTGKPTIDSIRVKQSADYHKQLEEAKAEIINLHGILKVLFYSTMPNNTEPEILLEWEKFIERNNL